MKQTIFNENQILFLQKLTDNWQTFDEISQKTGFSIEEIKLLIMDFIEFQNFIKRRNSLSIDLDFIILSPNSDKVKIGREGKHLINNIEEKMNLTDPYKYRRSKLYNDSKERLDRYVKGKLDFDEFELRERMVHNKK